MQSTEVTPPTSERVVRQTDQDINERIKRQTEANVAFYASRDRRLLDIRLQELDREWDIERMLEANAAMISLIGLITTAMILLFARGTTMFWIFGLLLTLWVGPAQASSRSFMARVAPAGREGEMFGLYATTGRAASFLAPGLFALFSGLFSDRIGIVGIALVLLAGALLLTKVKSPPRQQVRVSE